MGIICDGRPSIPTLICRLAFVFVTAAATPLCGQSQHDSETIARVFNKQNSLVGTIVSEDETTITVQELATGKDFTATKSADLNIQKPLSLDEAAKHVGLAQVVGWKTKQLCEQASHRGKVIRVAQQTVYMNLGRDEAMTIGLPLSVYRNEGVIVDPESGAELGVDRRKVAELHVTEVNQEYSKAKITSELETELEFGDEVCAANKPMVVGVCSIGNLDGTLTSAGSMITEDLTVALVDKGMLVVERSVMDSVLSELVTQNSALFDEQLSQEIGKLAGADAVLTGKIVTDRTGGTAHLRLIDVENGKILFAISSAVDTALEDGSNPRVGQHAVKPRSRATFGPNAVIQNEDRFPSFMTTSAALQRETNGGFRVPAERGREAAIFTKNSGFLDGDFTFEVQFQFSPQDDHAAKFAMGTGNFDRRDIILDVIAPAARSNAGMAILNGTYLNKINTDGIHTVRFIKEGNALTVMIDPQSDGPTDDDIESTYGDIKQYRPDFNSKNVYLYVGGSCSFMGFSLARGVALYPKPIVAIAMRSEASIKGISLESNMPVTAVPATTVPATSSKADAAVQPEATNAPEAAPAPEAMTAPETAERPETEAANKSEPLTPQEELLSKIADSVWRSQQLRFSIKADGSAGHFFSGGTWKYDSPQSVLFYNKDNIFKMKMVFSDDFRSFKGTWISGGTSVGKRVK
ncbi:FlgO family outer membrane protein [Neorhodopirellula pilleata]|nr:FlgO family outer membrane protein [Neorhodopirellula pilleata]